MAAHVCIVGYLIWDVGRITRHHIVVVALSYTAYNHHLKVETSVVNIWCIPCVRDTAYRHCLACATLPTLHSTQAKKCFKTRVPARETTKTNGVEPR